MKINLTKGIVTLISETDDEAITLFQFSLTREKKFEKSTEGTCEICGKVCMNKRGLTTHKAETHKIRSANYERNRKYYLRGKARRAKEAVKVEVLPEFNDIWK